MNKEISHAVSVLKNGGIGVMPTDTIYGIVASARDYDAVARVYTARKRQKDKPCLILIASIDDIMSFDIALSEKERSFLHAVWCVSDAQKREALKSLGVRDIDIFRPVSVVLPCDGEKLLYLHRGKKSLGFRMPCSSSAAMAIVKGAGPLIAPSANIAGEEMVNNIKHVKNVFGDQVDFYVEDQEEDIDRKPSIVVKCIDGNVEIVRA